LNAGDLRKPITLQKQVHTTNEIGEAEISWLAIADVWAQVSPLKANEILWARQAQLQTTHRVRCRWFPELTSEMRFYWEEPDGSPRILNISSIMDVEERHIEYVIEAVEQKAG